MTEDRELPPLVFERFVPHPVERVWAALTTQDLISRWLMENTFEPRVGHTFTFRAQPVPGWSGVTHGKVLELVPHERLVYTWGDGSESASGLRTVATWTLTKQEGGTLIRLEHSGFYEKDMGGYKGMGHGWPRIVERLDQVCAQL